LRKTAKYWNAGLFVNIEKMTRDPAKVASDPEDACIQGYALMR